MTFLNVFTFFTSPDQGLLRRLDVASTKPTVSGGNLLTLDDNGVQSSKASFDRPNNSEYCGLIHAF